jgi:hypothetical protein
MSPTRSGLQQSTTAAHAPSNHLIHRLSLPVLLAPSLLLAVLTGSILFLSSDSNVESVFAESQCLSPSSPLQFSRVPFIGTPLCYLTAFFAAALSSNHSVIVMSTILSFISALLTTTLVESVRICNHPSPVLRNPTLLWLVLNLAAGAVTLQAGLVPAAIMRSRSCEERKLNDPDRRETRCLDDGSQVYAIPISVVLGFVLPSLALLFYTSPVTILIWLFFPLYVGIVRAILSLGYRSRSVHIEPSPRALLIVYGPAAVISIVSHVWIVYSFFLENDATPVSRATLRFIEIDVLAMGVTMAYWLLIEVGWHVTAIFIATSAVAGPGTGLCIAWALREGERKEGKRSD